MDTLFYLMHSNALLTYLLKYIEVIDSVFDYFLLSLLLFCTNVVIFESYLHYPAAYVSPQTLVMHLWKPDMWYHNQPGSHKLLVKISTVTISGEYTVFKECFGNI